MLWFSKKHPNQTIEKVSKINQIGKMKNYTNLQFGLIVEAIRYLRMAIWRVCWGNLLKCNWVVSWNGFVKQSYYTNLREANSFAGWALANHQQTKQLEQVCLRKLLSKFVVFCKNKQTSPTPFCESKMVKLVIVSNS